MPVSIAATQPNPSTIGEATVTMDRRRKDRRNDEAEATAAPAVPRRRQQRRRHIDPTTCERDYSESEVEFMKAMDDYKQSSGRMFPTCSEVLEVLGSLGYVRLTAEQFELLGLDDEAVAEEPALSDEEADELVGA